MKRWLFNLAAGMSFLLFIASLFVMIHSFVALDEWVRPALGLPGPSSEIWIVALQGRLSVSVTRFADSFGYLTMDKVPVPAEPSRPWFKSVPREAVSGEFARGYRGNLPALWHWGFTATHEKTGSGSRALECFFVGMPLWICAVPTALLPALWLRSAQERRRRRHLFLCTECGYDLRATPERCPECGTITELARMKGEG